MSIAIGLFCGAFAIALFGSGVFVGWKLYGIVHSVPKAVEPPPLTDRQKQIIEEKKNEEEAFNLLMNYDGRTSYGVNGDAPF